ncbi:DUF1697 domain-containing protein [Reichenbachiella ulvae]|uniref:DUF1697 domain-containing protein n=1 Tax=Reichenbachiella ulvae TaxID=2980104 RepID=A0ABT3D083_9BACT|nr:DUF1697 domain-containing protein [Reichenbachiella ulvae]MCV9388873.1 DUF1697 domain-containing protein [Reichenbachiella ulvae]
MKKYIALLRGINVSGQKKIKMAELKETLASAGLQNVQTYIQSGNVIFESEESSEEAANRIEGAIYKAYNFDVPTLVFEQNYLQNVIDQNPFLSKVDDPKKLYAIFLYDDLTQEGLDRLASAELGGDEYAIVDGVVYTCYHNGMGKAKMDINFIEKKLMVRATSRNWRTVNLLSQH